MQRSPAEPYPEHVSFPDFIALFQKAETFTNDLAGGFVVPNRYFLADIFLHRFG
jgi:hypothetical protein